MGANAVKAAGPDACHVSPLIQSTDQVEIGTVAPSHTISPVPTVLVRSGPPPVCVETCMNLAASSEAVWEQLMFYEQIGKRPPLLLRFLLPVPVRTEGGKSGVGDAVKCHYVSGHLLKRVTQITRGRTYAFEVVEQNLKLGLGIRVLGGAYTLRELPEAHTQVALQTRYLSPLRPRWLWKRLEAAVCHSFHRHILSAMRSNLRSG